MSSYEVRASQEFQPTSEEQQSNGSSLPLQPQEDIGQDDRGSSEIRDHRMSSSAHQLHLCRLLHSQEEHKIKVSY